MFCCYELLLPPNRSTIQCDRMSYKHKLEIAVLIQRRVCGCEGESMLPIGCHWWKRLWDPVCTTASMSVPGACMMSVGSETEPLYNTLQHLDPVRRLIDPYANRQVFVHGSGSDHGTRGMRLPNGQVSDKRFTQGRRSHSYREYYIWRACISTIYADGTKTDRPRWPSSTCTISRVCRSHM